VSDVAKFKGGTMCLHPFGTISFDRSLMWVVGEGWPFMVQRLSTREIVACCTSQESLHAALRLLGNDT
jgi:hypothetical protein